MNRSLPAALALLASAGLASAADLVPGSDLGTREAQTVADQSVVDGVLSTRTETVYGYPSGDAARADARRPAERDRVSRPASTAGGVLVPGSDSF